MPQCLELVFTYSLAQNSLDLKCLSLRLSARVAIVRALAVAGLELPAQYLSFNTDAGASNPHDELEVPNRKSRTITGEQTVLLGVLYSCAFSTLKLKLNDERAFEMYKASE